MRLQILTLNGETAADRHLGPAEPAAQRQRPLAHQHGAIELGAVALDLEAGHQLGQGHHVGVSLHFTVTQVELAKQQGRPQGAVETGIGGDDPLQGTHLRD